MPSAGQSVDNILASQSGFSNRLDPSQPASPTNPAFAATEPAPFAVHDKDGPSHSFTSVCVQLCNDKAGPSAASPIRNNGFVRSYKEALLGGSHNPSAENIAGVMVVRAGLLAINQLRNGVLSPRYWFHQVRAPRCPADVLHAAASKASATRSSAITSRTIYELVGKGAGVVLIPRPERILRFKVCHSPDFRLRADERWASDAQSGNRTTYSSFPAFNSLKAPPRTRQTRQSRSTRHRVVWRH